MVTPGLYAICRLDGDAALPAWASRGRFVSITRTPDELSIVCEARSVPRGLRAKRGWRALAVQGPLDLRQTGILAALAGPLATVRISIFAVSTHDTDYVLIRDRDLQRAVRTLRGAGHKVSEEVT